MTVLTKVLTWIKLSILILLIPELASSIGRTLTSQMAAAFIRLRITTLQTNLMDRTPMLVAKIVRSNSDKLFYLQWEVPTVATLTKLYPSMQMIITEI